MHKWPPKVVQFVMTPKKIILISPYPKNYLFFWNAKTIDIQNFEPKNGPSLRLYENTIVPLTPPLRPSILSTSKSE